MTQIQVGNMFSIQKSPSCLHVLLFSNQKTVSTMEMATLPKGITTEE